MPTTQHRWLYRVTWRNRHKVRDGLTLLAATKGTALAMAWAAHPDVDVRTMLCKAWQPGDPR